MATTDKLRSNDWTERNGYLALVAVIFFLANQVVEYLAIKMFGFSYTKLCGWDCAWYAGIAEAGYDLQPHGHAKGDAANWAFFPALPLVARAVGMVAGTASGVALVLTSKLFFLLAIFAFLKFARAYRPTLDPLVLATVVALHPYSIYGNAGYTESLFLLLTCIFFYYLKRGSLVAAGVAGAFLTSARVVGVVAVVSYLAKAWRDRAHAGPQRERMLLGLLLIPLGLALFMFFLYQHTGDALAFSHIQRAWDRVPGNPLRYLIAGLKGNPLDRYWALMSAAALLVPVYFALRKEVELAVFSLGCTLIPLSTGLWSMPRYLWWQAPVLLALAVLLKRRLAWLVFVVAAVGGLIYMYFSWFSGKGFVI